MHKPAYIIIGYFLLLSVLGCAQEPPPTVTDGIYLFHFHLKDAKSDDPYRSGGEEYRLRIGEDGKFEFLDMQGRHQKLHGTVIDGQVILAYNFEGVNLQGEGKVTGNDQMKGTISAKLLEVDENSTSYRQVFEAEWTLIKKQ